MGERIRLGAGARLVTVAWLVLLVAGCGGGTTGGAGDSAAASDKFGSMTYEGTTYLGVDPALTRVDPNKMTGLPGEATGVSGPVKGTAVYAVGASPLDAVAMDGAAGGYVLFIRDAGGGKPIPLSQVKEVCDFFVKPQPGC